MRKYRHQTPDGWSKPKDHPEFMAAAGQRVTAGHGPFTLLVEGEKQPVVKDQGRAEVLSALSKSVEARRYDTVHRVRTTDLVVFTGKPVNVASPVRSDIVRWARWMVNNRGRIHYTQRRPYTRYHAGPSGELYLDCSASYANLCLWARANDPFGNGYNGAGNSYELHAMASISRGQALPGDGISWNGHVVMLLEPGNRSDPLLFSHGSEAGPYAYQLSSAVRIHGTSYKCHRLQF